MHASLLKCKLNITHAHALLHIDGVLALVLLFTLLLMVHLLLHDSAPSCFSPLLCSSFGEDKLRQGSSLFTLTILFILANVALYAMLEMPLR